MGSICNKNPIIVEDSRLRQVKIGDTIRNTTLNKNKINSNLNMNANVLSNKTLPLQTENDIPSLNNLFQKGDVLGKGKLGIVYRSLALDSGGLAVTKTINIKEFVNEIDNDTIISEVIKAKCLIHDNLNKYYTAYKSIEDENSKST